MKQPTNNKPISTPATQCRNCEHPFTDAVKYCPACGQKNTVGKASLMEIFGVFFSTVFNLESKFFLTMRDIFVPGKLTRLYFAGKRGRHFHPMRLFIVMFLFLVAALGLQISREVGDSATDFFEKAERSLSRQGFIEEVDSLSEVVTAQFPDNQAVRRAFDSLRVKIGIDSTRIDGDSINLNLIANSTRFKTQDLVELPPDQFIKKYNVEGFWEQLFVRQSMKLLKDSKGFTSFLLGKAIWIMLAIMPFLALLLKLLYIRRSRYYVEHLVFAFHIHAFAFILFTIAILLNVLIGFPVGFGLSILGVLLYTFFAMKKVYGQGIGKTFVKFTIAAVAYIFIFTLFLLMGSIIGVALF